MAAVDAAAEKYHQFVSIFGYPPTKTLHIQSFANNLGAPLSEDEANRIINNPPPSTPTSTLQSPKSPTTPTITKKQQQKKMKSIILRIIQCTLFIAMIIAIHSRNHLPSIHQHERGLNASEGNPPQANAIVWPSKGAEDDQMTDDQYKEMWTNDMIGLQFEGPLFSVSGSLREHDSGIKCAEKFREKMMRDARQDEIEFAAEYRHHKYTGSYFNEEAFKNGWEHYEIKREGWNWARTKGPDHDYTESEADTKANEEYSGNKFISNDNWRRDYFKNGWKAFIAEKGKAAAKEFIKSHPYHLHAQEIEINGAADAKYGKGDCRFETFTSGWKKYQRAHPQARRRLLTA